MVARAQKPVALTVAGSDSGGGAGIQADLKTFAALGVHGTSALTCLTAQNPAAVRGVFAVPPRFVRLQLETLCDELPPAAAKTGMLYSAAIVREVAAFFAQRPALPLVVDPVMVSTSGHRLLEPAAVRAMCQRLLPRAALITPNLDEAEILAERRLRVPEDLRVAAGDLRARFGCAVLVKGGHLRGQSEALDWFWDGRRELRLAAPFVRGVSTHGTGCTYSSAIVAGLAKALPLPRAVAAAKRYISRAIAASPRVGPHTVLGW